MKTGKLAPAFIKCTDALKFTPCYKLLGVANGFSERCTTRSNTLLNVSDTFTRPIVL